MTTHPLLLALLAVVGMSGSATAQVFTSEQLAEEVLEAFQSRTDPRAPYVLAHRLLEEEPTHLEGRRIAARLALEMASPALALDHVSFALARLGEDHEDEPFLRLAALAHEAMGEPAAAWNSLDRIEATGADQRAEIQRWQAQLLAQHYALPALDEIAARAKADLTRLPVSNLSGLWRAALVDPAAVEVELDRRREDLTSEMDFRDGFVLRGTLWLAHSGTRGRSLEAADPLRSLGPWLEQAATLPEGHDLRVAAALLQVPFDRLPSEQGHNSGGPGFVYEEDEMLEPEPPADLMQALASVTKQLIAARTALEEARLELETTLYGPNTPGSEVLLAISTGRVKIEAAKAHQRTLQELSGPTFALRGEAQKQAEQAYYAASNMYAGRDMMPRIKELERAIDLAPDSCLETHRLERARRVLAGLGTSSDPIAATDELIVWTNPREPMDSVAWAARLAALVEADPIDSPLAVRHAEASLAGHIGGTSGQESLAKGMKRANELAEIAQAAYAKMDFNAALSSLETAIDLAPLREDLLELRWRWLAEIAPPEEAARALLVWWEAAAPLTKLPTEEMELLYRANAWNGLLSVSEVALKDWPLSSAGYRFHSWAGAALDLPDVEARVHDYLLRSERGVSYATEMALRAALSRLRSKKLDDLTWLATGPNAEFTPVLLDAMVVAIAMREASIGREPYIGYPASSALKSAGEDPLRGAFLADEAPAVGSSLDQFSGDAARADFFAAATATIAGERDQAARLWRKCEANPNLAALLRTHAAREVARIDQLPRRAIRQRDAIYASPNGRLPSNMGHGRLIVTSGSASLAGSGSGAIRLLGVDPDGQASLRFPGDKVPLVIVENAAAAATQTMETSCAWIARGVSLGNSGDIVGPLDAVSCTIEGSLALRGTHTARFEDLKIGQRAFLSIGRPVTINTMAGYAWASTIRVIEGGTLSIENGVVDFRPRAYETPWILMEGGRLGTLDLVVIRADDKPVGHTGPGIRIIDPAPGNAIREVTVSDVAALEKALRASDDGDVIRLAGGSYNLRGTMDLNASVQIVGAPDGNSRLELMPHSEGSLRVKSGACVTLRNVEVANSKEGYTNYGQAQIKRLHVEDGGALLLENSKLVSGDLDPVTLYVASGGLASMTKGSAMSRIHLEQGATVMLDEVFLNGAWMDGAGLLSVGRVMQTTDGPERMIIRGATVRVAAAPNAYEGVRGGSQVALMADACARMRWDTALAAFDREIQSASSDPAKARVLARLATEIYAAGRVSWASEGAMEQQLFTRLVPLAEVSPKDAGTIVSKLPSYFPKARPMMEALSPEATKAVAARAKITLANIDRILDDEYLTLATEYELHYPLQHPDRARAMKYLAREAMFEGVADAIAQDKADEARAAEERRKRIAEAEAARAAATAAVLAEERARIGRAAAWNSQPSYSSYSSSSYVAAPSSYNSDAYYDNVAFYSRLNSLSGGGSYSVTASGVTYR